jgi:hypothetical protein
VVTDDVVVGLSTQQYAVASPERFPQGGERGIVFDLEDLTGDWTYIKSPDDSWWSLGVG